MRKIVILISILTIFIATAPAMAASAAGQRYINQIVGGGASSLRSASQSIYNTNFKERAVLDVLAEKVLQNYNNMGADSIAWACKALGRSGDIRYKNVLSEVVNGAANGKVKKHASKSLKMLPSGKAKNPYKKGSVNLAAKREKMVNSQPSTSVPSPKKTYTQQGTKNKQSISIIKEGMSHQEVLDLLGEPSTSTSQLTGKAFNPFYYGADNTRLTYLYKGKGRIFFRQKHFSNVWRVMEVKINPSETGYP
jgi:hypothetical protein